MVLKNRMIALLCGILGLVALESNAIQGKLDLKKSFVFAPANINPSTPTVVGVLVKKDGDKPAKHYEVTIFIDGIARSIVESDKDGVFMYRVRQDDALSDGTHFVYAVDNARGGYIRGTTFTVDHTRVSQVTRSGNVSLANSSILFPSEGFPINQDTFVFCCGLFDSTNHGVSAETLTLKIDGNVVSDTTQSNAFGVAVYQLTPGQALSEDTHTADAHCHESNLDLTQTEFVIDLTAPTAPIITSPTELETVTSSTVDVSGTAEPFNNITAFLDGDTYGEITSADENGNWTIEYINVEDGEHTIFATQTDAAYNVSDNSSTITFTVSA